MVGRCAQAVEACLAVAGTLAVGATRRPPALGRLGALTAVLTLPPVALAAAVACAVVASATVATAIIPALAAETLGTFARGLG